MVMRTFSEPSSPRKKGKKTPLGFYLVGSEPFSKIHPRSVIDLAVINSLGCSYEPKKTKSHKSLLLNRTIQPTELECSTPKCEWTTGMKMVREVQRIRDKDTERE